MRRFDNVQAMRGIASVMVVIGHANGFGLTTIPANLGFAVSGVDLFFVISGFIICTVARQSSDSPMRFLAKRARRIFPLYWIVLALSIALAKTYDLGSAWMPKLPRAYYVTLGARFNNFIPPAWTLSYEIYFYGVIFLLLVVSRKHLYRLVLLAMLGQAATLVWFHQTGQSIETYFWTSALVFEFGFGAFVAYLVERNCRGWGVLCGVFGVATFSIGAVMAIRHPGWDLLSFQRAATFGLGSALMLYAVIEVELRNRFCFWKPLRRLGDASYSIYLAHWLCLRIVGQAIPVRPAWGIPLLLVVIGVGFALHFLVEGPLLNLKLPLLRKPPPNNIDTSAPAFSPEL